VSVDSSSRLTAIVVDDEELARAVLREMLKKHPEIEVLGECANGFEAVKMVSERKPDLLFLDIQMPKLDGFEVLELIGADIAVIFATAYDQHALRRSDLRRRWSARSRGSDNLRCLP
jgi:two-component system, LytTR family, response regulator